MTHDSRPAAHPRWDRRGRSGFLPVVWYLGAVLATGGLDRSLHADTPAYGWGVVSVEAPFAPRDGAGLLVYQNKLWLIGGWNPDTTVFPKTTTNEVWNSSDGKHWKEVKPNTFGSSSFNPATDWEGRHTAGWAVFQNKLWIIGGDPNQCHYQPNVWNSSDGVHWSEVASNVPWGNRALFYTLVFNNRLWVMGGQTLDLDDCPGTGEMQIAYNDVWTSSDGASWTLVRPATINPAYLNLGRPLPPPRSPTWNSRGVICGAVVFNGRMWVVGGGVYGTQTIPQAFYNDVWSSADGVNWVQVTERAPWDPRFYHDVIVFDGHMWVIGGHDPDGRNLADVWYSSDGVHWTQLPNTPWLPRHAASVAVLKDALWLTGGSTDDGPQNDVWRLQNNGTIAPLIGSQLLQ